MLATNSVTELTNFSFEGDSLSLSDFSEFDSSSPNQNCFNDSSRRSSMVKMAPITTIETVTITRPLKVIAFICGTFVVFLMSLSLASTDWLLAKGWRQGLFMHCIEEDAMTPLPFNIKEPPGCHWSRSAAYIYATSVLCIITLFLDFFATLYTAFGLRTKDHHKKYSYYKQGAWIMSMAFVVLIIALITYPVCFSLELREGNRELWEFGWAYGVAWGAAIFLFGGIVLLVCDKESEEIYYKERKIVHDSNHTRA